MGEITSIRQSPCSSFFPLGTNLGGYKYPQGQKLKAGFERNGEVNGSRSSSTTVHAEALAANVSPPFKGSVLKEQACPNVLPCDRK